MKPTVISRADLAALPEYSCSIPTGTTIGKRWRRDVNAYRVSVSQVQASASPSIADRAAALESDPEALRIARELDDRLEEMLSRRVDAEVRDADP